MVRNEVKNKYQEQTVEEKRRGGEATKRRREREENMFATIEATQGESRKEEKVSRSANYLKYQI